MVAAEERYAHSVIRYHYIIIRYTKTQEETERPLPYISEDGKRAVNNVWKRMKQHLKPPEGYDCQMLGASKDTI